jgi:hypothetical protein
MKSRVQIYVLVGLVLILAYVFFSSQQGGSGVSGVFANDTKFVPLNVDEPQLQLFKLQDLEKLKYQGAHRDIFNAASVPIVIGGDKAAGNVKPPHPYPTVLKPPPIPPPQVPGTLYGYATLQTSGKRVAFFQEGDDVLVVEEGAEFLHGYRLIHVNDTIADVEEISTGRHATVQMTQPDRAPNGGGAGGDTGANQ